MSELIKLKVSPKGQITLPKKVRHNLSIGSYIYLEIKDDKAELKSVSFEEELKELMINDLKREGYSAEKIQQMLPEKKKQLLEALTEELSERGMEEKVSHTDALKELELD